MEKSFFAENRWSYPKTQKYLTTYQFNFRYFIFSVMSNYFLVSKIHNWFFFIVRLKKKCEIIKIGYFFYSIFQPIFENRLWFRLWHSLVVDQMYISHVQIVCTVRIYGSYVWVACTGFQYKRFKQEFKHFTRWLFPI